MELPKHISPKKQGANQIHRVVREGIFLFARNTNSQTETSWHACRTKNLVLGGLAEEPQPDHASMMVAQLTKVAVWKRFRVCDELGLGQKESGAPARPHVDLTDGTAIREQQSQRIAASWCFGLLMRCDMM